MVATREIPGAIPIKGREFFYIEYKSTDEFVKLFPELPFRGPKTGVIPKSGGMLNENVCIMLPEGSLFFGVSYKGDVPSWRAVLLEFCAYRDMRSATIVDGVLVTNDGNSYPLSRCKIEFYEI